jgi:hypothetical protein
MLSRPARIGAAEGPMACWRAGELTSVLALAEL